MKKSTNKTMKRRQLVLRRETIAELTPRQLEHVVGGYTWDDACVSQETKCVDEPI
jgi:natural product precursor